MQCGWFLFNTIIAIKNELLNAAGDVGPSGKVGRQGVPGPKGQKGQEGQGLSGVNYVRWGRTSCGGDAQVVYTGEYRLKSAFTTGAVNDTRKYNSHATRPPEY